MKKFLVFPGQGSQYPGMGKDWCAEFKVAERAFEEGSDGAGLNLKKLCFEGSESDLKQTQVTQPAILTVSVAIFRALTEMGKFEGGDYLFAGHSLGEYSALVNMGALSLVEAARLVNHRGQYMQEAVPAGKGAMAALIFKPKVDGSKLSLQICTEASEKTGRSVSVANFNSPEQIVISGETIAIKVAAELALSEKYGARRALELPVSAPFHCALMKPAAEKLSLEINAAEWHPSKFNYIPNTEAELCGAEGKKVAERLIQQITSSVRWVESVQKAVSLDYLEGLEIGPGKVLSGLNRRILVGERFCDSKNVDTLEAFKNE